MKSSGNTILVTGGSAGIGFELAKILSENDNEVIITGRNHERLKKASSQIKHASHIQSDVSSPEDVNALVNMLYRDFPTLNVVINNAGHAMLYDIFEEGINAYDKTKDEMETNFFSVIRLNEKLFPQLKLQQEAAIVNVSSVVAFLPGSLVGYSASKAALHSYSQSLRMRLEDSTSIKVFELMPPLVNTEFSQVIGGSKGISPMQVAEEFYDAWQKDEFEIHVGQTADLYKLYLASPSEALKRVNSMRKQLRLENE